MATELSGPFSVRLLRTNCKAMALKSDCCVRVLLTEVSHDLGNSWCSSHS